MLEAVSLIQDFCEDHNADMKADMDDIDAHLLKEGIEGYMAVIESFGKLIDSWLIPYISANVSKKKATRKKKKK